MEGKHLRNVAGGNLNSLAVGEDGSLWGWGNNKSGQLSSSLPASVLVPRRLENGNEWVQADSSALYTFATKTDGTLWYWGGCGTVKGNLARQCLLQPVQIGIQGDWEKISAGEKHCSLLKKDGSVWIFNPDQGDVVPKLLGTLH
jgi:hypothetical protein